MSKQGLIISYYYFDYHAKNIFDQNMLPYKYYVTSDSDENRELKGCFDGTDILSERLKKD